MLVSDFDYNLPEELIAQKPLPRREDDPAASSPLPAREGGAPSSDSGPPFPE